MYFINKENNSSKEKVKFDDEKVTINEIENTINKLGYEVKKSLVKEL